MASPAQVSRRDDGRICDVGSKREATVDDLYHVAGKAEIVHGELALMSPAGHAHGYAAFEIAVSLRDHARRTKRGQALPFGSKFIEGAPVFAVEVRSDEDDGSAAERTLADKRADYFAAGTLVVWDVDIFHDGIVRVYRASDPLAPVIYRKGERAQAEPAVPGWSMPVDDMFLPE